MIFFSCSTIELLRSCLPGCTALKYHPVVKTVFMKMHKDTRCLIILNIKILKKCSANRQTKCCLRTSFSTYWFRHVRKKKKAFLSLSVWMLPWLLLNFLLLFVDLLQLPVNVCRCAVQYKYWTRVRPLGKYIYIHIHVYTCLIKGWVTMWWKRHVSGAMSVDLLGRTLVA